MLIPYTRLSGGFRGLVQFRQLIPPNKVLQVTADNVCIIDSSDIDPNYVTITHSGVPILSVAEPIVGVIYESASNTLELTHEYTEGVD